jgi:hypothetical protein
MNNSLREVIENAEAGKLMDATQKMRGRPSMWLEDLAKGGAERAVCFDIGEIGRYWEYKIVEELVMLPYPVCWFECVRENHQLSDQVMRAAFLAVQRGAPSDFDLHLFVRGNPVHRWGLGRSVRVVDGCLPYTCAASGSATSEKDFNKAVLAFLSALNCINVQKTCVERDKKLKLARSRRGKKPLFSTWVLNVDLDQNPDRGPHLGGTHSSPRLHIREGHPRRNKLGGWCWVRPHLVGRKELGVVDKSYAVSRPIATDLDHELAS